MNRTWMVVTALGLGWTLGCDPVEVAPEQDASLRGEVDNGQQLNSAQLNGIQLNGIQLNGIQLNGIQLNGIQLNGIQLNGIQLNGSTLSGTQSGVLKSGPALVGAEMQLDVNGVPHTLRFDAIYRDPTRPTGDVWFYDISTREGSAGAWTSLCKDATGAPAAAIPIANRWNAATGARIDDANAVTFACRGAALAKCVEWGYIPWHTAQNCNNGPCVTISLKDHHQACTRMVRADYCGDGRSYTFDGTPIDIYDKLKVRIQTQSTKDLANWSPEAEWGPNGATCVGDELRLQMFDDRGLTYSFPACLDAIDDISKCGDMPAGRPASKIANSYCYKWTDDLSQCAAYNDDKKKPPPPPPPL